jgi:hypothetical protein
VTPAGRRGCSAGVTVPLRGRIRGAHDSPARRYRAGRSAAEQRYTASHHGERPASVPGASVPGSLALTEPTGIGVGPGTS